MRSAIQAGVALRADALPAQLQGGQAQLALAEGEKRQVRPDPGPAAYRTDADGGRQACGVQRHSALEPGKHAAPGRRRCRALRR
ncbi:MULTISPECIES: hypothetical protein [Stenotrophomonas]|uniref:Uncharacterized protein n=1 Tax=Stenotrophomonas nitritireducens TaxID=83617 RepID=A0ABR5NL77_9GAMM|nr:MULTISPECIES: hypothetical protein [Stenotrophomonas]KQN95614.1 hypothetical protein ASF01_16855 [Stenotrophomonas sp. Leaf70]KRG58594.1 hypothetical protein ABB22_07105 [Stenotrophomonas nitritireducens]